MNEKSVPTQQFGACLKSNRNERKCPMKPIAKQVELANGLHLSYAEQGANSRHAAHPVAWHRGFLAHLRAAACRTSGERPRLRLEPTRTR